MASNKRLPIKPSTRLTERNASNQWSKDEPASKRTLSRFPLPTPQYIRVYQATVRRRDQGLRDSPYSTATASSVVL